MTRRPCVIGALGLAIAFAAPLAAQAPESVVRARVRVFYEALSGDTPEQFEAMAQEAFTPDLLARRTADGRKQLFERVRGDFGRMTLADLRIVGGTTAEFRVRGTTGLEGRVELAFEATEPYRISNMSMRVEAGGPAGPEVPPPPISDRMTAEQMARAIDEYVAPQVSSDAFAGVVLIAGRARDGGGLVVERAYGMADREASRPVTIRTRFNLGSINKIFTKVAIGQLMVEGKLSLTDTIGRWLPEYPNERARGATIAQLLDHQAGIADFFGPAFAAAPKAQFRSNADYYRFVAPQPLLFDPGERRQYCNGCYIVLGAVIEAVTGSRYEEYIAKQVFDRAGMKTAGFSAADQLGVPTARGYTRRSPASGGALADNVDMHGVAGSAAGGGYATAADLLAFDDALREYRLLDPKTTAWVLGGDETSASGRARAEIGIAGGAPGINANLESDGTWTTIVLANLDPPAATGLGTAIQRQLTGK